MVLEALRLRQIFELLENLLKFVLGLNSILITLGIFRQFNNLAINRLLFIIHDCLIAANAFLNPDPECFKQFLISLQALSLLFTLLLELNDALIVDCWLLAYLFYF